MNPSIDGAQKAEVVPLQSSMVDWYTMYYRLTNVDVIVSVEINIILSAQFEHNVSHGRSSYGSYTCVVRYPYFYARICVRVCNCAR